ncbi:MAG: hypothetical protein ABSG00_00880 [Terracidiphilus sp.]|jgi:hypothetical protein
MNRYLLSTILSLILCPLLAAQQNQPASTPSAQPTAQTLQITGSLEIKQPVPQPVEERPFTDADFDRGQILKKARTICIQSETDFLTPATFTRALLNNKDWEKLGMSIVDGYCAVDPRTDKPRAAELEIQIDRVIFTHIHTYVLTDRSTGVVLASGRVRAFDGVVASGPMAEKIVSVIFAAKFPAVNKANSGS